MVDTVAMAEVVIGMVEEGIGTGVTTGMADTGMVDIGVVAGEVMGMDGIMAGAGVMDIIMAILTTTTTTLAGVISTITAILIITIMTRLITTRMAAITCDLPSVKNYSLNAVFVCLFRQFCRSSVQTPHFKFIY